MKDTIQCLFQVLTISISCLSSKEYDEVKICKNILKMRDLHVLLL